MCSRQIRRYLSWAYPSQRWTHSQSSAVEARFAPILETFESADLSLFSTRRSHINSPIALLEGQHCLSSKQHLCNSSTQHTEETPGMTDMAQAQQPDPESLTQPLTGSQQQHHDQDGQVYNQEDDEHTHYSHRAPWLRAFVLGANDGLVSVAALMMGVGGGSESITTMRLAGVAAWIGGALSMAVGEYISVASQRDAEEADIEKERVQQAKGPAARAHELEELTQIYVGRGLSRELASAVARELTDKDVIRAHARDELGIDLDELANPLQASVVSALAFTCGAALPLLAGWFVTDQHTRLIAVALATTVGLAGFGLTGSALGGARVILGAMRVLMGGWFAMAVTFGVGKLLGTGMIG